LDGAFLFGLDLSSDSNRDLKAREALSGRAPNLLMLAKQY